MAFTLSIFISAESPRLQDSTEMILASIMFQTIKLDTLLKGPILVPKSHSMLWELLKSQDSVQVKLARVFKSTSTTCLSNLNTELVVIGAPVK